MKKKRPFDILINPFLMAYENADKFYFAGISPVIDGDPPGTPGISIFVVPKYHVNPDGSIGKPNDVTTTGMEHKMGIEGFGHLLAVT
jgi:hypothetical protein